MKNVAFRVDVSKKIGTGHFMRCLALAIEIQKSGAQICFLSRNLPEYLANMLMENSIELGRLPLCSCKSSIDELAHADWLGMSQADDACASMDTLSSRTWDWLVVDHYSLDFRWENKLRQKVRKIMAIDDLADRRHDCDILLDQNYHLDMQNRYKEKLPTKCRMILGPRYALLREDFKKLRQHVKFRGNNIKRLLVFFGGMDEANFTMVALDQLSKMKDKFIVDVVIGDQHPKRTQILKKCAELGYFSHIQTNRMPELMVEADLAIGAGGSTCWERCCLGLPSLLFAVAENQISISKALSSINACIYMGSINNGTLLTIEQGFNLIKKSLDNTTMSKKIFSLVDGTGTSQVSRIMGF